MSTGRMRAIARKVRVAYEEDSSILCAKKEYFEVLGNNPDYLADQYGITKSDLAYLERQGLALKARYETNNPKSGLKTGPHRTRWLVFTEVLDEV